MDEPTDQEKDAYIEELKAGLDASDDKNRQLGMGISNLSSNRQDANLIQYQLDTVEMVDKLEHFYRGDYIGFDKKGNQIWKTPVDKEMITFNEFGVSSMMEIVTKYIDKNTSLSYYSEERIYEILGDLGDELTLFILCNYEKMGMDTYFKKTKFRLIIVTTLHVIESSYRRAIRGKTFEDINQSRIVTQSDNPSMRNVSVPSSKVGFLKRIFNPGGR